MSPIKAFCDNKTPLLYGHDILFYGPPWCTSISLLLPTICAAVITDQSETVLQKAGIALLCTSFECQHMASSPGKVIIDSWNFHKMINALIKNIMCTLLISI